MVGSWTRVKVPRVSFTTTHSKRSAAHRADQFLSDILLMATKPYAVVVFGRTGVGVSSLINLIVGYPTSNDHTNAKGPKTKRHLISLPGSDNQFSLYEVPGFGGPVKDTKILDMIRQIERDEGIDLFIHCFRKQKATILPQVVRQIRDSVPGQKAPMIAAVTELERFEAEGGMEEWWDVPLGDGSTNGTLVERMCFGGDGGFDAHACITTLPLKEVDLVLKLRKRRDRSEELIRKVILEWCQGPKRTHENVTFWGTLTRARLGFRSRRSRRRSITPPPEYRAAIVAPEQQIVAIDLSLIKEPEVQVHSAVLDAWKRGRLADAEALLTAAMVTSRDTLHHVLASRALVRARLGRWDAAVTDSEESIKSQPSIIGYIAKCVALVGKGEIRRGYRVCDIAFLHFYSDHVALLLLMKAVVLFMNREYEEAISRVEDLITAASKGATFYVIKAYMSFILGNLSMEKGDYEGAIYSYERARVALGDRTDQPPLIILLISGWKFDNLAIQIQKQSCEVLLAAGRAEEAGESVLHMIDHEVNMTESNRAWASDFVKRCLSTSERDCNVSGVSTCPNSASKPQPGPYHMALLREWAKFKMTAMPWKDALAAASGFVLPRSTIYQVISEHFEMTGHMVEAVACFNQMCNELGQRTDDDEANWTRDFKSRCCAKLENVGDSFLNAGEYDEAISQYTMALSLDPTMQDLLVKRSTAHTGKGEWDNALNDATEVIRLNPSSPWGYEKRHAALHGKGEYLDAIRAFETMLANISQSSDPEIRERARHYVMPERIKTIIDTAIGDTIRDSPLVLVNTNSGRLCDKLEQAAAFKSIPAFTKLISTMSTHVDDAAIKEEVREFYRYATFSHKWEENEPLYDEVVQSVVYDLEATPTRDKLRTFCKIVQEAGLKWAWSDTCCIDKKDHFILQEALVSMFKWYENSVMTIVFLFDVDRLAPPGAMTRSIWNMRAWTLQEYRAAKVVRFYTRDWTPYLGLSIDNHKDAPEIILEMEQATGISAQALVALRPGLDDIREKLSLASPRQTTRVEDAAYSLLGIFSVSMPILYGDGDKALGQLLAQILTGSGDTRILAWTGRSGSLNSCLPTSVTVFGQLLTSYIPPPVPDAEIRAVNAGSRSLDVTKLYDRLDGLPAPFFVGRRMKLPCLTFKLGQVLASQNGSEYIFRAQTKALGVVEIRTEEDLSRLGSLFLVHPWIDFLLDRQPVGNVIQTIAEENEDDTSSVQGELLSLPGPSNIVSITRRTPMPRLRVIRFGWPFGSRSSLDVASLRPPSTLTPVEKQTHVLQFIARLRQPFGALLLTRTRQNMEEYRRVAAESLIRVQVEEISPAVLDGLIAGVRVVDVL